MEEQLSGAPMLHAPGSPQRVRDPIVKSMKPIPALQLALRIEMSCGHALLRYAQDPTWAVGEPHFCEACLDDERVIVRATPQAMSYIAVTLSCGHDTLLRQVDGIIIPPEVLLGTTLKCQMCRDPGYALMPLASF